MNELHNLKNKISKYNEVLQNTESYRKIWKDSLRDEIKKRLQLIIDDTGLQANIEERNQLENLSAVMMTLGNQESGIYEKVSENLNKQLLKQNGLLVYQQLFNGKIQVLIIYPFIEGHGEPRPPKMIGIYRPEELKEPFLVRHCEEFIKEITQWEDYDDDEPSQIAAQQIGFHRDLLEGDQ